MADFFRIEIVMVFIILHNDLSQWKKIFIPLFKNLKIKIKKSKFTIANEFKICLLVDENQMKPVRASSINTITVSILLGTMKAYNTTKASVLLPIYYNTMFKEKY